MTKEIEKFRVNFGILTTALYENILGQFCCIALLSSQF